MSRPDMGTTDVPSAGTRVQISALLDDVKSIAVKGRKGNTGNVYFGLVDVSATNGWELEPGEAVAFSFGDGSTKMNLFYVDAATSGDDVDWAVVFRV